jgi:hypothetical protein
MPGFLGAVRPRSCSRMRVAYMPTSLRYDRVIAAGTSHKAAGLFIKMPLDLRRFNVPP